MTEPIMAAVFISRAEAYRFQTKRENHRVAALHQYGQLRDFGESRVFQSDKAKEDLPLSQSRSGKESLTKLV